jgi:hypothetical protein
VEIFLLSSSVANYVGHFADEFYRPTGIRCRLDIQAQLPPRAVSADARHHCIQRVALQSTKTTEARCRASGFGFLSAFGFPVRASR